MHRLAQNPFLSIEISTLQSIKYLIEFLENKWKTRRNQFVRLNFHIFKINFKNFNHKKYLD